MDDSKQDYHDLGRKDAASGGARNTPHSEDWLTDQIVSPTDDQAKDQEDYNHGYDAEKSKS